MVEGGGLMRVGRPVSGAEPCIGKRCLEKRKAPPRPLVAVTHRTFSPLRNHVVTALKACSFFSVPP